MIIPLRTDRALRHTPWVNMALIAINVVVFLATRARVEEMDVFDPLFRAFLNPKHWTWYQFLTWQFLHADIFHLLGNMLFLYVFGNSVEDRLRPWGYALFYLSGGVVAGIGHCLMDTSPAIGASGAVAAVTGAFLALFPKTQITAIVFLIFIYPFVIPGMYLIGLFMVFDLVMHAQGVGQTAYAAHLSGYAFGFSVGMLLLGTRILPREPYDLPSLIKHWNRRREFRALTSRGSTPWHAQAARSKGQTLEPEVQRLLEWRAAIRRDFEQGAIGSALDQCQQLLTSDPKQVLDRDLQSVMANHAMQAERHDLAVRLYEGFLATYPKDSAVPEFHLMLGLIYLRYLAQPEKARPHVLAALEGMVDDRRRPLAESLLAQINAGETES